MLEKNMSNFRDLIDYAEDEDGVAFRNALYGAIHDKVTAHIEAKKQDIARNLITAEEIDYEEEPEEDDETHEEISESMRLVSNHVSGPHTAKVYKDTDWNEYRTRFYKDGKHLGNDSDYHTDDLHDAKNTAKAELERMSKQHNEEFEQLDEIGDTDRGKRDLAHYINKATRATRDHTVDAYKHFVQGRGTGHPDSYDQDTINKGHRFALKADMRARGIDRAGRTLVRQSLKK